MKSIKTQLIAAVVILLFVGMCFIFLGKVGVTIGNNTITVKCTLVGGTTVSLNEITSVDYIKGLDIGKRVNGLETVKMDAGTYKNNEFNEYKLYSYSNVNAYIVVHYGSKVLVFNQSSVTDTEKVYEQLKIKVKERK